MKLTIKNSTMMRLFDSADSSVILDGEPKEIIEVCKALDLLSGPNKTVDIDEREN